MKTVAEVSRLAGVSVRTLHHYDAIGLLKPTKITEAGYRLYDDAALRRLQTIRMYRELEFSLKEIGAILDSPGYDPAEALAQQIRMLELQREHIDGLIALAREIQTNGGIAMSFQQFSHQELEQYKEEARERWGYTEAYQEYSARDHSGEDEQEMMAIFADFGKLRQLSPNDPRAQAQVGALQRFITENYYSCTKEILFSLGQMYVADERFRENIDRSGGEGTAEFAAKAIEIYCA